MKRSVRRKLGMFMNCVDAKEFCTRGEGLERLVVKRDPDTDLPQVCICRLGPYARKKFRGRAHDKPEHERKPFGKWKDPKHLRRCIEYDEDKKKCKGEGEAHWESRHIPGRKK